jgi:hypothetical protein
MTATKWMKPLTVYAPCATGRVGLSTFLPRAAKYQKVLARMRRAMDQWVKETKDLGEIPEGELVRRGIVREVRRQ